MRSWLKQYFIFNSGERKAIIAIVVVTVVVVAAINAYRYFSVKQSTPAPHTANVDAFIAAYDAQKGEEQPSVSGNTYKAVYSDSTRKKNIVPIVVFKFDPNTIGIAEWQKLGFSEKQAASIEKYKAKGGIFYKVEDLKKLYVVSDDDYKRIAPYVVIQPKATVATKTINLNNADSVSLEALPGIGATLTHRILQYRARNGAIKNVEELKQIKGMSEENYLKALPYLKL